MTASMLPQQCYKLNSNQVLATMMLAFSTRLNLGVAMVGTVRLQLQSVSLDSHCHMAVNPDSLSMDSNQLIALNRDKEQQELGLVICNLANLDIKPQANLASNMDSRAVTTQAHREAMALVNKEGIKHLDNKQVTSHLHNRARISQVVRRQDTALPNKADINHQRNKVGMDLNRSHHINITAPVNISRLLKRLNMSKRMIGTLFQPATCLADKTFVMYRGQDHQKLSLMPSSQKNCTFTLKS